MQQLNPIELQDWFDRKEDFVLVDVREPWEHDAFNIGGLQIPLGDIMRKRNDLPSGKKLVLYCEKGIRSLIAIQRLEDAGCQNLYNLAGGMKAWKLSFS